MKMPKNLKYMTAKWEVYSDYDVGDVNWEEVERYYIKYNMVHIDYKNGDTDLIEPMHFEFEVKWPEDEKMLTKDWNEIAQAIDDEHVGVSVSQAEVDTLLSAKTGGMFSDGAVSMDSYGAKND